MKKCLVVYNPNMHDYSKDKPSFEEVKPGHYVYGNALELEGYRAAVKN